MVVVGVDGRAWAAPTVSKLDAPAAGLNLVSNAEVGCHGKSTRRQPEPRAPGVAE